MGRKKVQKINNDDLIRTSIDYERYVIVNSNTLKSIYGENLKQTKDADVLEGFVKIISDKSFVYRKVLGRAVAGDYVQMGYRTQCELNVDESDDVTIKPANWMCYLWYNSEAYIKYIFRIAVFGLTISFASLVISIVGL